MAALQFVLRLQRSIAGKALLLTSPKGRRAAGRDKAAPVPGEALAATRDLCGQPCLPAARGAGWDPTLLWLGAARPDKQGAS